MSKPKVGYAVTWLDHGYTVRRGKVVSVDPLHDCFLVDYPDHDNHLPTTALTSADIHDEDDEDEEAQA